MRTYSKGLRLVMTAILAAGPLALPSNVHGQPTVFRFTPEPRAAAAAPTTAMPARAGSPRRSAPSGRANQAVNSQTAMTAGGAGLLNPNGEGIPPRAFGRISQRGERDYWLFYAPASGVANFSASGIEPGYLDLRLTVVDVAENRTITGPIDQWGWRLIEQAEVRVQAGRWYGLIIDGLGARSATEATGDYDIIVSAPGRVTSVPARPSWPSSGGGFNPPSRSPTVSPAPTGRVVSSWVVTRRADQASRRSSNCFVSLSPGETARIEITGLPDSIRGLVRFTLMHDKRNARDQPRASSIGHGSIVSGRTHNWPGFGERIYIGRLEMPWALDAFFRVYPNFRVELRVVRN
jgi:hypothetical protein